MTVCRALGMEWHLDRGSMPELDDLQDTQQPFLQPVLVGLSGSGANTCAASPAGQSSALTAVGHRRLSKLVPSSEVCKRTAQRQQLCRQAGMCLPASKVPLVPN